MIVAPDKGVIERVLESAGHRQVAVHAFDQLPSTSVWLRERYIPGEATVPAADYVSQEASPVSHLCVTDWQNAGIARRGRTWQTKPGNITFSMLTSTPRTSSQLLGLSLVTGIGIANALMDTVNIQVQLKWPNDVLLGDAKLGGLLTELSAGVGGDGAPAGTRILTGIGINLLHDEEVRPLGIGATSLEYAGVDIERYSRDVLVGQLAAAVLTAHQQFHDHGWDYFAERWRELDWLMDKDVQIHREQSTEHAVARGVSSEGALLVEQAGRTLPLYSGNVSIRPTT